jgi:hypothetical protein
VVAAASRASGSFGGGAVHLGADLTRAHATAAITPHPWATSVWANVERLVDLGDEIAASGGPPSA